MSYLNLYQFLIASVTNDSKASGLNNTDLFFYHSRSKEPEMGFTGPKPRR